MKVKLKANFSNFKTGEVVDIHYRTAEQLVTNGKAEPVNVAKSAAVVAVEKPAKDK